MSKNINISNEAYNWLLDLSLDKSKKERRKVSIGEIVNDLMSKKKKNETKK